MILKNDTLMIQGFFDYNGDAKERFEGASSRRFYHIYCAAKECHTVKINLKGRSVSYDDLSMYSHVVAKMEIKEHSATISYSDRKILVNGKEVKIIYNIPRNGKYVLEEWISKIE